MGCNTAAWDEASLALHAPAGTNLAPERDRALLTSAFTLVRHRCVIQSAVPIKTDPWPRTGFGLVLAQLLGDVVRWVDIGDNLNVGILRRFSFFSV